MVALKRLIIVALLSISSAHAQELSYTPEILVGQRSTMYLHLVKINLQNRLSLNNLTLFDTEYTSNSNNIYFIRNTATYQISNRIFFNTSVGVKNPGHFGTVSLQYKILKENFTLSYSAGSTYQNGYTLEQSLATNYTKVLSKKLNAYFSLLAIANVNFEEYQRGLQQIRAGFVSEGLIYGIGANFDQFNNSTKTLFNLGVFIKYPFN